MVGPALFVAALTVEGWLRPGYRSGAPDVGMLIGGQV